MKNNQAVGYIRVSTQEQAKEGISLDAQVERIEAYAKLAKLDLVEIVRDEGVSGAELLARRPGGEQVTRLLAGKKPKACHVIALKLDRLFRNAADALTVTGAWDHGGVALHLVDMGGQSLNTASSMGRMMLTMLAGFAEWERAQICDRTRDAMAHMKAHRSVYGRTPLGFQVRGDRLVEDATELRVVEQIRRWRGRGWTFRKIVATLERRQVATKTGGKWHPGTVKYLCENNLYDVTGGCAA